MALGIISNGVLQSSCVRVFFCECSQDHHWLIMKCSTVFLFQHVAHSMSMLLFKDELEMPLLKCGQANTDFTLRGVQKRGRI